MNNITRIILEAFYDHMDNFETLDKQEENKNIQKKQFYDTGLLRYKSYINSSLSEFQQLVNMDPTKDKSFLYKMCEWKNNNKTLSDIELKKYIDRYYKYILYMRKNYSKLYEVSNFNDCLLSFETYIMDNNKFPKKFKDELHEEVSILIEKYNHKDANKSIDEDTIAKNKHKDDIIKKEYEELKQWLLSNELGLAGEDIRKYVYAMINNNNYISSNKTFNPDIPDITEKLRDELKRNVNNINNANDLKEILMPAINGHYFFKHSSNLAIEKQIDRDFYGRYNNNFDLMPILALIDYYDKLNPWNINLLQFKNLYCNNSKDITKTFDISNFKTYNDFKDFINSTKDLFESYNPLIQHPFNIDKLKELLPKLTQKPNDTDEQNDGYTGRFYDNIWQGEKDSDHYKVNNGYFSNVDWYKGIWNDGKFKEGQWRKGTWYNGEFIHSVWGNGLWYGGEFKNSIWKDGIFYTGTFEDSIWKNGTWENGIFKDSLWENGIWEDGIWLSMWGKTTTTYKTRSLGSFSYQSRWNNGVWKKGKIQSIKFGELIDSKVNPTIFRELEIQSKSLEELKSKVSQS